MGNYIFWGNKVAASPFQKMKLLCSFLSGEKSEPTKFGLWPESWLAVGALSASRFEP